MCQPCILYKAFSSLFPCLSVFCLSLTVLFFSVGDHTQRFSISCGCDVSPPQAISSDLSAFFQAIHKNSASIYKRRLCPRICSFLPVPLCLSCSVHLPLFWLVKAWSDVSWCTVGLVLFELSNWRRFVTNINQSNLDNFPSFPNRKLEMHFSFFASLFLWIPLCLCEVWHAR